MHELAIANNVFDIVVEHLQRYEHSVVRSIRLKIGALSCVQGDSLQANFEMIAMGTPLEGVQLLIEQLPVIVFCPVCQQSHELVGIQDLTCPVCKTPTGDIRQGRELDVDSIEILESKNEDSTQPNSP